MRKKSILLLVLLAAACMLTGCNQLKNARPIEDVHRLEGQRVGVGLAWGPDYLLSDREDMTLVRYNTIAGLVTALCYQRVDAIAVERVLAPEILYSIAGVRVIDDPIATEGMTAIVPMDRGDLLAEFNAFIKEFHQTEDYAWLMERSNDEEGYWPEPVELVGGTKTLRVGITDDNYPFTYINFETREYEGIDIEVITHFANACGYDLEFVGGDWTAMENGIYYGQTDIAISAISDLYKDDFILSESALVSDVYMPVDIIFIEIEDPDALAVRAAIEY